MDSKKIFPIMATILVLAIVLVGEVIVVTSSHDDYSSSVYVDNDELIFTIDSRNAHEYTAVSLKNSLGLPETVSVYFDPDYPSAATNGVASTGARALDEEYYVQQLSSTLKVRGIDYSEVVDAKGLQNIMSADGKDHAVIVLSGTLPDTVYDGSKDSLISKWIESGGRLYWAGGIIGKYISHRDSLEEVPSGTSIFLGSECIGPEFGRALSEVNTNGFHDALYLQNNKTAYGVVTSELPDDTEYICLGFTDGERSSATIVSDGNGIICILGGDYSIRQRIDLTQLLASGIGPTTELADLVKGSVHGSENGRLSMGDSVYITLGGYSPVYCSNLEVKE